MSGFKIKINNNPDMLNKDKNIVNIPNTDLKNDSSSKINLNIGCHLMGYVFLWKVSLLLLITDSISIQPENK